MRAEIENRPLLLFAAMLAAGIGSMHAWPIAILFVAGLLWVRPLAGKWTSIAGFGIGLWLSPPAPTVRIESRMPIAGDFMVAGVPQVYRDSFAVEITGPPGKFRMVWKAPELSYGDAIHVVGEVRPLRESSLESASSWSILGRIYPLNETVTVRKRGPPIFAAGTAVRRRFIELSDRSLAPEQSAIIQALCFNLDSGLSQRMRDDLQRTGTIHIISASGAHVLIFAVALTFVLGLLPIPRQMQLAILLLVLATYAAAAGFRPPIVRAVIMAGILSIAYFARREPDLLAAMAAAMTCYLLWKPESVFDIGFQLSFATVAALGLYFANGLPKPPSTALGMLVAQAGVVAKASFVASLASAPLVAYHFGTVSVIAIVANLAIAGLVAPLLTAALAALAATAVSPILAFGLMSGIVGPLTNVLEWLVTSMGSLPFAAVGAPNFSPYWIAAYYAAFLIVWRKGVRPA